MGRIDDDGGEGKDRSEMVEEAVLVKLFTGRAVNKVV